MKRSKREEARVSQSRTMTKPVKLDEEPTAIQKVEAIATNFAQKTSTTKVHTWSSPRPTTSSAATAATPAVATVPTNNRQAVWWN